MIVDAFVDDLEKLRSNFYLASWGRYGGETPVEGGSGRPAQAGL
jgi:hypothetical protein